MQFRFERWLRLAAVLLVACALTAAFAGPPARASEQCDGVCDADQIYVGEDATTCHCKDRSEYFKCVRDAGRRLQNKIPTCEGVITCLRRNDIHEEVGICAAALLLIPLSIATPPAVPAAIGGSAVTCGWLTRDGLNKARDCLNGTVSACKTDALTRHRNDLEDCKKVD